MTRSLAKTLAALLAGEVTSGVLVEEALDHINDPSGEGSRAFISVFADDARAMAARADARRARGGTTLPLDGIPISIKDLFNVAGAATTAGSLVLRHAQPAERDAEVVTRLRKAGAVVIGRTNMTEFAFSGLGINPHHGTPLNPFDRKTGLIPGGSSSGAAVSVADGMCAGAIGSDTGGSVRIPAALCGLAGFKPTQRRTPLDGVFPLSPTLDSVGPIARTIADCILLDRVICEEQRLPPSPPKWSELQLAVPTHYVLEDLDSAVSTAFSRALTRISAAGASVTEIALPALAALPQINAHGTFPAIEAYRHHRALLATSAAGYDPRVRSRIEAGAKFSEADYENLRAARRELIRIFETAAARFDALVFPTTPIVAPSISSFHDEEAYRCTNLLMLRNPTVVNFVDGCAATVPCHAPGQPPSGLMIVGRSGQDLAILAVAQSIEHLLATPPFDRETRINEYS